VIGPWIAETQAKKVTAQAEIRTATGRRQMSRDDIAAIVAAFAGLAQVVKEADPADKADLYAQLKLTLTYQPGQRLVEASVKPGLNMLKGFVSEGDCTKKPMLARGRVRPWSGGLTMPADLPAGHLLPYSAWSRRQTWPVRAERGGYFEFCRRLAPCWTGAAR
jgi:hypothetical protein